MKKRISYIIIVLVAVTAIPSCMHDGIDYFGYYHSCEAFTFTFKPDSTIECHMFSTEFVGHFSDYHYGHFTKNGPYIDIVWDKAHPNNMRDTKPLQNPDSAKFNATRDTLHYWESGEEFILTRCE